MQNKIVKMILITGALVGSLDITAAFIDYFLNTGNGPERVLFYIASGVFGQAAFSSGPSMIWLGLLFHFIIAFAFTIFFFLIYPRAKWLHINVVLLAAIIGVFIWMVMSFIVVPLSNTPKFPFQLSKIIKPILILICMIGLPLSIILRSFFKDQLMPDRSNKSIVDPIYN